MVVQHSAATSVEWLKKLQKDLVTSGNGKIRMALVHIYSAYTYGTRCPTLSPTARRLNTEEGSWHRLRFPRITIDRDLRNSVSGAVAPWARILSAITHRNLNADRHSEANIDARHPLSGLHPSYHWRFLYCGLEADGDLIPQPFPTLTPWVLATTLQIVWSLEVEFLPGILMPYGRRLTPDTHYLWVHQAGVAVLFMMEKIAAFRGTIRFPFPYLEADRISLCSLTLAGHRGRTLVQWGQFEAEYIHAGNMPISLLCACLPFFFDNPHRPVSGVILYGVSWYMVVRPQVFALRNAPISLLWALLEVWTQRKPYLTMTSRYFWLKLKVRCSLINAGARGDLSRNKYLE
ncbi:hypothetical protein EDD85DRAFT_786737 [Armillaria nabsnona]|nr:hypothetical protein EDD85DRAFT_786737 [Armillaria nabsnona]